MTSEDQRLLDRYPPAVLVRIKNPLPFVEPLGYVDNVRFEVGQPIRYHVNGEWYTANQLEPVDEEDTPLV